MKRLRAHVRLESASLRREGLFLEGVRRSRKLHRTWGSPPSTSARFRKFLKARSATHRSYFVFSDSGDLVGVITISEIVRGSFQSGYLGYYALAPHQGHGYMTAGLAAVMRIAFVELRLHRLEANIQPGNAPSIALVKRLGFRYEGRSSRYLKIGGRWRDHERWAITVEDLRAKERGRAQAS